MLKTQTPVLFNRSLKKDPMPYTLITATGKIMQFYVKDLAEMYAILHGGQVITSEILVDNTPEVAV